MDDFESALVVGIVVGAHGVRGALKVRLSDPDSTTLRAGLQVGLRAAEGAHAQAFEVERVSRKPGTPVVRLWLEGMGTREAADGVRGHELLVDRKELPALDEDEFYLGDLIGMPVQRDRDGARQDLGNITAVSSNGLQDLFEVTWQGQSWLFPVVPGFILEVEADAVLVDIPLGMLPDALEET